MPLEVSSDWGDALLVDPESIIMSDDLLWTRAHIPAEIQGAEGRAPRGTTSQATSEGLPPPRPGVVLHPERPGWHQIGGWDLAHGLHKTH